jgi:peptidoglycan/xylan/chitin deacetylase (PgdA/CDA1 family)
MFHELKEKALTLAEQARFFGIAGSRWRQNHLLILCYHGVSLLDEHEWHPQLYLQPDYFEGRLDIILDLGYTVLPLQEGVTRLYAGTLPKKSVVVTFDDGTVDFYRCIYPALQKRSMPATLYLTTYYAQHRYPVFDMMLSYLLWRGRGQSVSALPLQSGQEAVVIPMDRYGRDSQHLQIRQYCNLVQWSTLKKNELLQQLAGEIGVDFAALLDERLLQIMSPDEIAALDPALVDLQLHTHRHRTPHDRALFIQEIDDNRRAIREILGRDKPLNHFCYPSGEHVAEFLPWLREAGIDSATTTDLGLAGRRSDPFLLPRLTETMTLSPVHFAAWLSGLAAFLPKRG